MDADVPRKDRMTDTSPPLNPPDQPGPLVDRVRIEMARRRALADALRPPKRRNAAPGAPIAQRPPRRVL
jgi:hypothetical protein